MNITKADGVIEPFDEEKVIRSIVRTGASHETAKQVLLKVKPQITEGMTTAKLYHLVRTALEEKSICYSCRYNLREAIFNMGPAGFNFEYYIAAVLRAYGHDASVPQEEIQGSCVSHEVDIVSEKDGRTIFIEAKFRNERTRSVNLKDTMATWSRYVDLVDGGATGKGIHFDEVWIVTNARFSDRAKQFGTCKGMRLIGWSFPKDQSFEKLVDKVHLYPITAITDVQKGELRQFAESGLLLCKDIEKLEPEELGRRVDISVQRSEELIGLCSQVIHGDI